VNVPEENEEHDNDVDIGDEENDVLKLEVHGATDHQKAEKGNSLRLKKKVEKKCLVINSSGVVLVGIFDSTSCKDQSRTVNMSTNSLVVLRHQDHSGSLLYDPLRRKPANQAYHIVATHEIHIQMALVSDQQNPSFPRNAR